MLIEMARLHEGGKRHGLSEIENSCKEPQKKKKSGWFCNLGFGCRGDDTRPTRLAKLWKPNTTTTTKPPHTHFTANSLLLTILLCM